MDVKGKIKLINELETFDSGFTKRSFVVTTDEQYPQDIIIDTVKDKTSLLNHYKPGDEVTVFTNLRGNEHKGRYFINLTAWKIQGGLKPQPTTKAEAMEQGAEVDDLPF